jgi:AraC-like DNA-binding protein
MLTSATVRDALRFSVRYHSLTMPMWHISMHEADGEATWTFRDRLGLDVDDPLYRFLYELQLSAHKSLGKDLWDEPPQRTLTQARYQRPPHAELYEEWLGHAVEFGQAENRSRFDARALDEPLPMHHPLTAAMVRDMCDRLLGEAHTASSGRARHVYEMLTAQPGRFRDMTELSRALNTSPRTLRRHLQAEGTSYQSILDDVRCNLAKHYLQDTRMTGEDIATALGFSDSANFRHAFHKWASQSPSEFRRRANRGAAD